MRNVRTAEIVYPPEVDGNKLRIKRTVKMTADEEVVTDWQCVKMVANTFAAITGYSLIFFVIMALIFGG